MSASPPNKVSPNSRGAGSIAVICMQALEYIAQSTGLPFNAVEVQEAITQAEFEYPGSWKETWMQRIQQIGADLGMSITTVNVGKQLPNDAESRFFLGFDCSYAEGGWLLFHNGKVAIVQSAQEVVFDREWTQVNAPAPIEPVDGGAVPLEWVAVDTSQPCEPLRDDQPESTKHYQSPFRRLLALLRQEKNDIWVIVLFSLGIGIFSLATPIAVEAIVSTVHGGAQVLVQPVVILSFVLLLFLGLAAVLRIFKAFVVEYIQQRLFVRVVVDLSNRLPQVDKTALDRAHGPELVNRFFDVLTIQKAGAVLLVDGLSVVIQAVIGLLVIAFFHPFLLGFDLVLLGAVSFIIFALGQGAVRTSIAESYAKYHVAGWLEEIMRNPLVFKMGGGRHFAMLRANQLANEYIDARRAHFKILFRQILFGLMLQAIAGAALFGIGGLLVINRGLTLGQLVAAELILATIIGSLIKLGKSLESYYDLAAAVDKLGHLIDLPLEIAKGERLGANEKPARLALRKLSFTHQNGTGNPVLSNLNAVVEPGNHLALLGSHASGKSTLLELIYGLRKPSGGRIELDGVDLQRLRLESVREQISIVKDVEIFEGSILQNIVVGRSLSSDAVRQALDNVVLWEEINQLPDGVHTKLTTGGIPLSYGQVRRLMIARAIVNRPRLLLVDEALDDLNDSIRDRVLGNLAGNASPWTLITATHSRAVADCCKHQHVLRKI